MLMPAFLLLASSVDLNHPAPVQCRIAVNRMVNFLVLGQGMVENLERRGVPPERKERYDAMKAQIAADTPLLTRLADRYAAVHPTPKDEEAFGSPSPIQMRELLTHCDR